MKILIGAMGDDSGSDALALGSLLCRAFRAEPLLCHVHPAAFDFPGPAHVDAEWRQYLRDEAAAILRSAAERMEREYGWQQPATVIGQHQSSGQGLAEAASQHGADMVVIGSAPGGRPGAFQIGSTANKLLHGSPVPVALAPQGYRQDSPAELGRVVVGFRNTAESVQALQRAAEYAATAGVPLTVLTVLVKQRLYGSRLGGKAEDAVNASALAEAEEAQKRAVAETGVSADVRTVVADSPRAALQRMQWAGDEVLVLASARGGPLRRVFLGDMTYKLLRATPVPAIVLPRHSAG